MLQEFGIKCWVLQQDGQNSKLDPKSQEFIFVGLLDYGKAWRYWNPHSVRVTGHRTPGESSVILQIMVMIQLTSRRILRD